MDGTLTPVTTAHRRLLLPALAVVGAAFVAFQAWGYLAWALDGGGERFEIVTSVPDSTSNAVLLGRIVTPVVAALWLTYVVRGVLRTRALTWPALVTLAWALTYWQESLANATGVRFAYNALFFDLGDWTGYLPFVDVDGPGLAQPLAMETFVFVGMFPVFSWAAATLMRTVRDRTGWRPAVVALIGYLVVLVVEYAAEMRSISQGVHSYPEVFGALSIRDGAPDQFPLYENWLLGLMWFLPGLALFLLRDRPVDPLALPPVVRPGPGGAAITVLAAAGALNIAFLLYNLIAFVWLPADTVAPMPPWLNP